MDDDKSFNTSEIEKLCFVIESKFGEVKERLDRIERLVSDQAPGACQGRKTELKRWTSSVATKVGIRLVRALAKEAVPKNGRILDVFSAIRD